MPRTHSSRAIEAFKRTFKRPAKSTADQEWIAGWIAGFVAGRANQMLTRLRKDLGKG